MTDKKILSVRFRPVGLQTPIRIISVPTNNTKITQLLSQMIDNPCCRIKVGQYKSLSLGFGAKLYHGKPQLNDEYYGEWEIGTYNCSWRIIQNNIVVCASNSSIETIEELDKLANNFEYGNLASIAQLSDFDLRIEFSSGITIDFITTFSEDDECFHIFCPGEDYIEYSLRKKWEV